ncbi:MAG: hypothetical protein ACK45H_00320 [Bacteroidota bacterium]|jgi:hypothetical protein
MKKEKLLFLFISMMSFIGNGQMNLAEGDDSKLGTQLGFFLNVDAPFASVMPEMSTTGLIGFSLAQRPYFGSPFLIEFKAAWGNYGRDFFGEHNFELNGWLYSADVTYKSGYQKYLLGPKFMLGGDFRAIRGFATPQIGFLRMRSKTSITYYDGVSDWSDQNDDGSEDVWRTPLKSTGWAFGAEIGTEISIQRLFKPDSEKNTYRLLISGSFLRGFKEFSYGDADKLLDPSQLPDDANTAVNYVNISHPQVWEKKYVQVFRSALQMWGINVGVTINI